MTFTTTRKFGAFSVLTATLLAATTALAKTTPSPCKPVDQQMTTRQIMKPTPGKILNALLSAAMLCALALTGGVGLAQAQDAVTAINILLLPDAAMLQHAQAANDRLRKVYPKGFSLDAIHRPHITMVQRFVRTSDLISFTRPWARSSPVPIPPASSWKPSSTTTSRTRTWASRELSRSPRPNCSSCSRM